MPIQIADDAVTPLRCVIGQREGRKANFPLVLDEGEVLEAQE